VGQLRQAIVAVAVAVTLTASASVAHAGMYVINNCPAAGNGNSGPWTIYGAPQADLGSCSGGPGSWIGPLGGTVGVDANTGVQIDVPAGSGITISQVKAWWAVPSSVSGATTFALASTNTGVVGMSDTPLNRTSPPDDFVLPSSATWFSLDDYCSNDDYSNSCTIGGGENADLQLFGSQVTLSDSNPPSGSVTGGALAGSGSVSGTQSLSFDASDGGPGVRLIQLLVDGQVVATNDYGAECPYQNFAACPATISDSISWNTASVANGPHEVALRIVNAAQVPAIVDDHSLVTHNPPHTPNGSPACESAGLTLVVNGKSRRALIRFGRRPKITGMLACGNASIVGATIAITGGGLDTSVTTSLLGQFSYQVPPGPNRTIRFVYRAFADDLKPAAAATAHLAVLPRIRLSISPRRTFDGGTIAWHGEVAGGPYPAGGVTLLVEVREGRRWQPFDEIIARDGSFGYRYTFLRTTEPTNYKFRVALPANGADGYDYDPAGSNTITVHVR
jgi:hypothetical protein